MKKNIEIQSEFINKNDLDWLTLTVREVDNERPWMELIHVTDGSAYATDGHRMHVAPCKLDDGSYHPYELQECLDFEREPPTPINNQGIDINKIRITLINQSRKAFNPASETTASDFYVQNGFYGELIAKDGNSMFNRLYVLEATFGMSTKGATILHVHNKEDGENFMYANDGKRSFIVMGKRLAEVNNETK